MFQETLFQVKSKTYQENQPRSLKQGLKKGLNTMGGGIFALILGLLVNYIVIQLTDRAFGMAQCIIILSPIIFLVGVIMTVIYLLRPSKSVICPKCHTKHRLYRNVEKYMCEECRTLLLLGEDAKLMPQFSTCSYCGLQTAVTSDHGYFICPNCGIIRESSKTNAETTTQNCPECNEILPEGVIYCKTCGRILMDDFSQPVHGDPTLAFDLDWKIGKDATGHYQFSKALMKSLALELKKERENLKIHSLIPMLENIFLSVEQAMQDNSCYQAIEPLIPKLDLIYADLLDVELQLIQSPPPKYEWQSDDFQYLSFEPHIKARRRVEEIFANSLKTIGSIGAWDEHLVIVQTVNNISQIVSFEKLKNEAARFKDWKDKQLG